LSRSGGLLEILGVVDEAGFGDVFELPEIGLDLTYFASGRAGLFVAGAFT